MSQTECPNCPKAKQIGFLIKIDGKCCSGIPAEFAAAPFKHAGNKGKSDSRAKWIVRSPQDEEYEVSTLPILWEDTENNVEIFRRKEREKEGWRVKDFVWFQVTSQTADLLLAGPPLVYVLM